MKPIELLAPAGDLEKFKIAIHYGADAVYCGGESFSLRAGAKNMTLSELSDGVQFAHDRGKKVYFALNILAHNEDLQGLESYVKELSTIPFDAYIVADPGVFYWLQVNYPGITVHLSTQANTTNSMAASFWHKQGIQRIVLARELSLAEIRQLKDQTPDTLELEAFVHGAMCISYSGRCLLSNFMVGRDANRGECTHPCRWNYQLVEEKRPGEYFPIEEDQHGSYIMNSKDLCMIEHIPELIEAGVNSFKIEGRNKSVFYVASVVRAYRNAIDAYVKDPANVQFDPAWMEEVSKASHRLYTKGFYFGNPGAEEQNYETSQYVRDYTFCGIVKSYDPATGLATIEQRNKLSLRDEIELFGPTGTPFVQRIDAMYNLEGEPISTAPHAQQIIQIRMQQAVDQNYMVCIRKEWYNDPYSQ